MYDNSLSRQHQIFLNFNANKIRWLTDSKISSTNIFCIGSGENQKRLSLWTLDLSSDDFEPELLCESEDLDGEVTELKAKNFEELFLSTSSGSIYYFKYLSNERRLVQLNKWSNLNGLDDNFKNQSVINSFDFEKGLDELCYVTENGSISFIRTYQQNLESFEQNELCSLNSVIYLKQFEVATADSLGRIKLWDTRVRNNSNNALMNLNIEGECSPIMCMSNHPNQQHMIACGNLNGLVFIYDVRSQKKPFIMSHNHYEPVTEICFHPFSVENLLSSSFDGSLWYWNASSKSDISNWDDRSVNAKNYLPNNKYSINSFDINNEHILAVNNNYGLFKIKNISFI